MRKTIKFEAQTRHLHPPWSIEDQARLTGAFIDLFWLPAVMFRIMILSMVPPNMRAL